MTGAARRTPMRLLGLLAVCAVVVAGCGQLAQIGELAEPPEPLPSQDVEVGAEAVRGVNESLREVAELERQVSDPLREGLEAVTVIEPTVAALRDPERIDAALEELDEVLAEVASVDAASARTAVARLGTAVARARAAVDTASDVAAGRSAWVDRWLAAQRAVLDAVAEWGRASDVLAVALDDYASTGRELLGEAVPIAQERFRYRTAEEAAGTYEVAAGTEAAALRGLADALMAATAARDEAAAALNAADTAAEVVWQDRPTGVGDR